MSITATSTLSDVLVALNTRTVSSTDWTDLNLPTAATTWTAKVGLFGDDLTGFFANCATVGYLVCNRASYAAFSGWAVGLEIAIGANPIPALEQAGACFGSDSTPNCVVAFDYTDVDQVVLTSWTDSSAVFATPDSGTTPSYPIAFDAATCGYSLSGS